MKAFMQAVLHEYMDIFWVWETDNAKFYLNPCFIIYGDRRKKVNGLRIGVLNSQNMTVQNYTRLLSMLLGIIYIHIFCLFSRIVFMKGFYNLIPSIFLISNQR